MLVANFRFVEASPPSADILADAFIMAGLKRGIIFADGWSLKHSVFLWIFWVTPTPTTGWPKAITYANLIREWLIILNVPIIAVSVTGYYSVVRRIIVGFKQSYPSHGVSAEAELTTAYNYILIMWPSIICLVHYINMLMTLMALSRLKLPYPSISQNSIWLIHVVHHVFSFSHCAVTEWMNNKI